MKDKLNQTENNENELTEKVSIWKLHYELASKKYILISIFAIIASIGYSISYPLLDLLFGMAISSISINKNSSNFLAEVNKYSFYLLLAGILNFALSSIMFYFWSILGKELAKKIKIEYFRIIMSKNQSWFDSKNCHEFSSKIEMNTKSIENGVGQKIGNFIHGSSMGITALIMAFIINWKLSLILSSFFPLLILSVIYLETLYSTQADKKLKNFEECGTIIEERIVNIKTVIAFSNLKYESEKFNKIISDYNSEELQISLKICCTLGFFYFLIDSLIGIGFLYSSQLIIAGDLNPYTGNPIKGGDLYVVIEGFWLAAFCLTESFPSLATILQACKASEEYFKLKREDEENIANVNDNIVTIKPSKEEIRGKISFKKVCFKYSDKSIDNSEKLILNNFNITFEYGQITAIVGTSGSGKTTIISLIDRLYEISEGEIQIDDYNIKDFDLEYYRSLIGYVPQEPILLNTSIRKNIIFGRENVTESQLIAACVKAKVTEFTDKLEKGLDTLVASKGSTFSGGQKQRIAIARAILNNPKILILDEATSALDNKIEKEVQEALQTICKGITTIIIAHRLSTVQKADKICVVQDGVLVEEGDHQTLILMNGKYTEMISNKKNTCTIIDNSYSEQNEMHYENLMIKSFLENESNTNFEIDNDTDILIDTKLDDKKITGNNHRLLNTYNSNKEFNEEFLEIINDKIEEKFSENKKENELIKINKNLLFEILLEKISYLILAIISSAFMGAIWPLCGLIFANGYDAISNNDKIIVEQGGKSQLIYWIVVGVFYGIFTIGMNYSFNTLGTHLVSRLREITFNKYLRMNMGFFDLPKHSAENLVTKLLGEISDLNTILQGIIGSIVQYLCSCVIALGISFYYDWRIALINIFFIPLNILAVTFSENNKDKNFSKEAFDNYAGDILSESVCNTKTIFSYNMQNKVVKMYNEILDTADEGFEISVSFYSIMFGISIFSVFASPAATLYASAYFISEGTLTLVDMLRVCLSLLHATIGLGFASKYLEDFNKAKGSLNNLFRTLEIPSTIDPMEENKNSIKIKSDEMLGKIEFRNVCFEYDTTKRQEVYKNLNFIIYPGQSVAFVGASGSGKSTILQLLLRFYDIDQGQILIDDVDIKEYDLVSLRNCISLVQQEPVLFKMSLMENIRYGNLEASDQEVKRCAEQTEILHKLGEENINLSGGEKQRVAIARALIRNPKILLLDEATSALDSNVEAQIQKNLDKIIKNRTSIIIAHRLSTVEKCDNIFVMENGEIVEEGSHEYLFNLKKKYYELYNI